MKKKYLIGYSLYFVLATVKKIMGLLTHGETLQYWKDNAEEDYLKVPISVLKYIAILEEEVLNQVENDGVSGDVNLRTYSFDCWDMSGKLTTKKVTATCEDHAILKFEKENDGEFGYDPPYVS